MSTCGKQNSKTSSVWVNLLDSSVSRIRQNPSNNNTKPFLKNAAIRWQQHITSPFTHRGRGGAPNPLNQLCGSAVVVYRNRVSRPSPSLLARHPGSVDLKEPRVVFSALGISSHCALTHRCVRASPRLSDKGDSADTSDYNVEVCPMCREPIA